MTGINVKFARKNIVGDKYFGIIKKVSIQTNGEKIILRTIDLEFHLFPLTIRLRDSNSQWKITLFVLSFGLDIGIVRERL